mmetsp:Transcript_8507/g.12037  ORF Transcript_8507/g.12037 Transcript_8507/m.12037 type:complete len:282 (+) Transcript_8507:157-1002(+)
MSKKKFRELQKFARTGKKSEVKRLLDVGLDVNSTDRFGRTILMDCANRGYLDIIRMLAQEYKADVQMADNQNRTALMDAAMGGHADVVHLLAKKYNADINAKNKYGATALFYGAHEDQLEAVKVLVEDCGASINVQDEYGDTALIVTARWGRSQTTQYLLESRADTSIKGRESKTALAWALERKEWDCARTIIGHIHRPIRRVLERDFSPFMLHRHVLEGLFGPIPISEGLRCSRDSLLPQPLIRSHRETSITGNSSSYEIKRHPSSPEQRSVRKRKFGDK